MVKNIIYTSKVVVEGRFRVCRGTQSLFQFWKAPQPINLHFEGHFRACRGTPSLLGSPPADSSTFQITSGSTKLCLQAHVQPAVRATGAANAHPSKSSQDASCSVDLPSQKKTRARMMAATESSHRRAGHTLVKSEEMNSVTDSCMQPSEHAASFSRVLESRMTAAYILP